MPEISSLAALVQGMDSQKDNDSGGQKDLQSLSVKSIDTENHRITAIASTSSMDRDGDIILPSAFKKSIPGFMKNPVLLACHHHSLADGHSPVVGNVVEARVAGKEFRVVVEFEPETELGREYWTLYSKKRQRAFSVGFIPKKWENRTIDNRNVRVYTEVELLELSCVPIPSNRDALSRSAKKKEWLTDKITERGLEGLEAELDELRAENPDFDREAEEYAKAILEDTDKSAERIYTFREVAMMLCFMDSQYKKSIQKIKQKQVKRADFASGFRK